MAQPSQAEGCFRPGRIVLNQGDTIKGELLVQGEFSLSKSCTFRTNQKAPQVVYHPFQIKGYQFNSGRRYVSTVLPESGDSVFLRFVLDGVIDLYMRENAMSKSFYYLNKDQSSLVNLRYFELPITTNFVDTSRTWSNYKTSLYLYTDDCPSMYGQVRKLKDPNYQELHRIIHRYQSLMQPNKPLRVYDFQPDSHPFVEVGYGLVGPDHLFGLFFLPSPLLSKFLYIGSGYDTYYGIPFQLRLRHPIYFIQPEVGVGMDYLPGYDVINPFYHWTAGASLKLGRISIGARYTKHYSNWYTVMELNEWSATMSYEIF